MIESEGFTQGRGIVHRDEQTDEGTCGVIRDETGFPRLKCGEGALRQAVWGVSRRVGDGSIDSSHASRSTQRRSAQQEGDVSDLWSRGLCGRRRREHDSWHRAEED